MFNFKVISPCYQNASGTDYGDCHFLLESDRWNDFSYRTLYHLHATPIILGGDTDIKYIGSIKILKAGQTELDYNLVGTYAESKNGIFNRLDDNFCSISFSPNLYKDISLILQKKEERIEFAEALNLIFSKEDERYKRFKNEQGFEVSLLRTCDMDDYSLSYGRSLLYNDVTFFPLREKKLQVSFNGSQEIDINFSSKEKVRSISLFPDGVVAFVGRNGVGKSTTLYNLAKWIYMTTEKRKKMTSIRVTPDNLGVQKMILISYSAFDNFTLPGETYTDFVKLAQDLNKYKQSRFIYCGVRDVKKEINIRAEEIKQEAEKASTEQEKAAVMTKSFFDTDHIPNSIIKPINTLAKEFYKALETIFSDHNYRTTWDNVKERSRQIHRELFEIMDRLNPLLYEEAVEENYIGLSTGHKFFLHALAHIIAYTEKNSLILFDEPENHLHPPMLSFMMTEIRRIIKDRESVMLVATHSPVILQETFSRNTIIVRRNGDTMSVSHPEAETYGNTTGNINNMVFDLNSDITKYHKAIDWLYEELHCSEANNVETVIELIDSELDTKKISAQMTAYIINKYYSEKNVGS